MGTLEIILLAIAAVFMALKQGLSEVDTVAKRFRYCKSERVVELMSRLKLMCIAGLHLASPFGIKFRSFASRSVTNAIDNSQRSQSIAHR